MSYPICADAVIAIPPYLGEFTWWIMTGGLFMGLVFGFTFGVLLRDIFVKAGIL